MPPVRSAASIANPIVWRHFLSENDLTWILLRGNMGYRRGDLILKGDGNTPVILAPRKPAIAWDLYQAVEIRMLEGAPYSSHSRTSTAPSRIISASVTSSTRDLSTVLR